MSTGSQHMFKVVEHMVIQSAIFPIYKDAENTTWDWSEAVYSF